MRFPSLHQPGPRDWLRQTAGVAAPSGGQGATRSEQPWGQSDCRFVFFPRANPYHAFHRRDENLAIANLASAG